MPRFWPIRIPMFLLFVWCALLNSGLLDLQKSQNTGVCTRGCTWVFDTVDGRSKCTFRWFNTSPMVFISMFSILSIKICENNSQLSFYQVCYFTFIRDLQNPWKVKAALEVEKAKAQNLKSNLTCQWLTTTGMWQGRDLLSLNSVPSHIKVHRSYFEDAAGVTNKQGREVIWREAERADVVQPGEGSDSSVLPHRTRQWAQNAIQEMCLNLIKEGLLWS